jgi:hypothetical protein
MSLPKLSPFSPDEEDDHQASVEAPGMLPAFQSRALSDYSIRRARIRVEDQPAVARRHW